jgi:hypothetical protein
MKPSFGPLLPDAIEFLMQETDVDFSRTDFQNPRWFCVTARRDDGTLMGVLACEFKTWFDVYFSTAICDRRCLSRRLLGVIFQTLFTKAIRITAEVDPANNSAAQQCRRMGFVYEGFKRLGIEGRRDALIFGMLRDDCRFLPGYHPAHTSLPPVAMGGFHGLHS